MSRGRFISLEGGEGVGKTSSLETVADEVRRWGLTVIATREPGGTELGEGLRRLLLQARNLSADAELLMMFAARLQHAQEVILPALGNGCWVISDRFTDSSYAYQGGGRGVPIETIQFLEERLPGSLKPDLTLLLDAPVEIGLARVRQRGATDRFESEEKAFQERVRSAYLARADACPERVSVIDASQAPDGVRLALLSELRRRCADWL